MHVVDDLAVAVAPIAVLEMIAMGLFHRQPRNYYNYSFWGITKFFL